MTPPLTYLQFHLVFTIPPLIILGWLAVRRDRAWLDWQSLSGLAILIFLAVVYTTPWTNLMIPEGVWWYGEDVVLTTIWHTPLEEYMFFVLQTSLTAFWLFQFLDVRDLPLAIPTHHRVVGILAGLGISTLGWSFLQTTATYYLGSILFWAGPIFAIQWGFGLTYLIRERRKVLVAVGVPTLYLWVADWIAISLGVWSISGTHTTGIGLANLPVEEALFFLVTNVFVVQGIVLYVWVLARLRSRRVPTGPTVSRSCETGRAGDDGPEGPPGARATASRIAAIGGLVTIILGIGVAALPGTLSLWVQLLPLAASVLLLGVPHGSVDHLVLPRARGDTVGIEDLAFVGVLYLVGGGLYAVVWVLTPALAFAFFILLTLAHWGQGDHYTLLEFAGVDTLERPGSRALAVVVRGSLPMLVPLVAFPAEYAFVADALIGLFDPAGVGALDPAFTPTARLAVSALLVGLVGTHLTLGVVRTDDASAWRVDAVETLGLCAYFAVVPPLFAIGLYFCFWHSLRHVLRAMLVDDRASTHLAAGHSARAFGRFSRDAAPLTAAALIVFGGLAVAVPVTPVTAGDALGLYLVGIAILTLPHAVVVTLLDIEQEI